MSPTAIAAYLALFTAVGFGFLFANLVVGWLLRPKAPNQEKLEIYECGEPTIGSSFVQFDLRFYVVALLFIIFDVEVAFFFPWATVFGKANQLRTVDSAARYQVSQAPPETPSARQRATAGEFRRIAENKFAELGLADPRLEAVLTEVPPGSDQQHRRLVPQVTDLGKKLAFISVLDIGVFFAVLLVGFFYVWSRGDLDWVRALSRERGKQAHRVPPGAPAEEAPALVG